MNRTGVVFVSLTLAGCMAGDGPTSGSEPRPGATAVHAPASTPMPPFVKRLGRSRQGAIASLPDRGALFAYRDGDAAKPDGAYTWHHVDISEEHALRAVVQGRLRVPLPSGETLDIQYDHHLEHASGDWTWIGHVPGQPGAQTILTFGQEAMYGAIARPGQRSLELTTARGVIWLVETDPGKLAGIASAAANPKKTDYLAIPKQSLTANLATHLRPQAEQLAAMHATSATGVTIIDVNVYTTVGYRNQLGDDGAVRTRLRYLETVTNQAFANSQVRARVRLLKLGMGEYPDATPNSQALQDITGYDNESGQRTTPHPAFEYVRLARDLFGADLVVLLRAFRDPEQGGCGTAWLVGGGKTGIVPGDGQDYFGYSVVSDGADRNEQDGQVYVCRHESLAHELAHNMGSAHDRVAAQKTSGDPSELDDPGDYGAYDFSFGYKTSPAGGNFSTIMAYGDGGQTNYRVYSNPRTTFCGSRPCGTAAREDNARSLALLAPMVAQFRRTGSKPPRDIEGDRISDLLVRTPTGFRYYSMTTKAWSDEVAIGASWQVVATGDFNDDRYLDLVWAAESTRALYMWLGGPEGFRTKLSMGHYGLGWSVVGAGDVDGDRKTDLLWRYYKTAANNFSWWVMDGPVRTRVGYATLGISWRVAAVGNFGGDNKADVLWSADSTRTLVQWNSTGASFIGRVLGRYPLGWSVVGPLSGVDYGDRDWWVDFPLLRYYKSGPRNIGYWNQGSVTTLGSIGASWKVGAIGAFRDDSIRGNGVEIYGEDNNGVVWVANSGDTSQIQYDLNDYWVFGRKYPFMSLPSGWTYINR